MRARRAVIIGVAAVAAVAAAGFLWIVLGPGPTDFASGPKVALSDYRGANPSGVPARLAQASPVERGEYLARAADCMACHTAPDGKRFAGGLAFSLPFGTLYSTNITPDKETGIGNYSDADFLNALQRGTREDGAHLYPAMPFASYTRMTVDDALAIKAYLFSLPPVDAPDRDNPLSFPFNQRALMGAWAWLFNPGKRFQANAAQTPEWNRGAYIAEALAHCGECHTPRNLFFAVDNRRKFGGALTAGWRAYDISSDSSTGVGAWREEDLVAYLSTGHAMGRGTATGPMGEAVEFSLSHLAPEDIRAVAVYLRSVPAISSTDLPATLAPPAPESHRMGVAAADPRGKRMFEGACASCHDWTGVSPVTPLATLTGARAVNDPSAANVVQVVISGTKHETPDGAVAMPGFGNTYSDAEIAAVANYVTARFGTKGATLTESDVADLRRQAAY
jgi:mono/diheme cytochrome c family protein